MTEPDYITWDTQRGIVEVPISIFRWMMAMTVVGVLATAYIVLVIAIAAWGANS